MRPTGDDRQSNIGYCLRHATHSDWRSQAEDSSGAGAGDGGTSADGNRTTENCRSEPIAKPAFWAGPGALQFRKATELIGGRLRAVSGLPLRNSGKNDSRYTLIPGFLSLLPSWSKI